MVFLKIVYYLLLYFTSVFIVSGVCWVERKFGTPTFDQILYHLRYGMEMIENSDKSMVISFFKNVIVVSLVTAIVLVIFDAYIKKSKNLKKIISSVHFDTNKHVKYFKLLLGCRTFIFIVISVTFFLIKVSAFSYVFASSGDEFYDKNYFSPRSVLLNATETKNLVLVYVESLEETYSDAGLFEGKNLLSSFEKINGVSFNRFVQIPGAEWTMGGIVSSQCGVPLKNIFTVDEDNVEIEFDYAKKMNRVGSRLLDPTKSFMPNAECLGDILQENGYVNVFIGGASVKFAGKGSFLESHGYGEIFGREELLNEEMTLESDNGWGFTDDLVFEKAKLKLQELHASGNRFNLTVLTLDTHGPDGIVSNYCEKNGVTSFDGIVECVSAQVADFVNFIKDNGYLKDTNVVVLGDHLAMMNPLSEKLNASTNRKIFNKFISDDFPEKNMEELVHFDFFPTILEFIGFEIEGGRLGLGYSGFNKSSSNIKPGRIEEFVSEIPKRSSTYSGLWM